MDDALAAGLDRYAELMAAYGLNVQPGQLVNITTEACHRELAYQVARRCYERGARHVEVDLLEPRLAPLRVQHGDDDDRAYVPPALKARFDELVDTCGAHLRISGSENPGLLEGLDPSRIDALRHGRYRALERFYTEGVETGAVHWTVAAAATPGWAARVFPDDPADVGQRKLWDALLSVCRCDRDGAIERWQAHDAAIAARRKALTEAALDTLHFSGPGTDLVVGLDARARWEGGTQQSPRGVGFEANLPTEEVFTTPDWRRTEGTLRTTRPILVTGTRVEGLTLTFAAGEVTAFDAERGRDAFGAMPERDDGARRLGEVALVGTDSPVYRSGLVFEEILLDENAACHVALGSAYVTAVAGGAEADAAGRDALGINASSTHLDMMISDEAVDVTATARDGTRVPLIRGGAWVEGWA